MDPGWLDKEFSLTDVQAQHAFNAVLAGRFETCPQYVTDVSRVTESPVG